jgi:hypothetical protein
MYAARDFSVKYDFALIKYPIKFMKLLTVVFNNFGRGLKYSETRLNYCKFYSLITVFSNMNNQMTT